MLGYGADATGVVLGVVLDVVLGVVLGYGSAGDAAVTGESLTLAVGLSVLSSGNADAGGGVGGPEDALERSADAAAAADPPGSSTPIWYCGASGMAVLATGDEGSSTTGPPARSV